MNKLIPKRAKPKEHLGEQNCISSAPQGSFGEETVESVLQNYLSSAALPTVYPEPAASSIKLQDRPPWPEPEPKHKDWVQLSRDQLTRRQPNQFASGAQHWSGQDRYAKYQAQREKKQADEAALHEAKHPVKKKKRRKRTRSANSARNQKANNVSRLMALAK